MPDGTRNGRQARRNTRKADVVVLSTWPREGWVAALWESDQLTPSERLVGLAYARKAFEGDTTYVAWSLLSQMTGIKSKTTLSTATKGLVAAGWLEQVAPARQHYSPRYRLVVPERDARAVYDADEDVAETVDMTEYRAAQGSKN